MALTHRDILPLQEVDVRRLNTRLRRVNDELSKIVPLVLEPPDGIKTIGAQETGNIAQYTITPERAPSDTRVYLPAGTHYVRGGSVRLGDSLMFGGSGFASILELEKMSSSSQPMVKNDSDTAGNALLLVERLRLIGNANTDGLYTEWDHGVQWKKVTRGILKDCYIASIGGDGVYISDGQQHILKNLFIRIPTLSTSPLVGRNGIAIVDGKRIIIESCIIQGGYPAVIDIEPNTGQDIYEVIIRGNVITHWDDDDTDLATTGMGIEINQTNGNIQRIIIDGNLIVGTQQDGIAIMGYANESASDLASDITISNNVLYDVNRTGTGREGGISVANQFRRVQIVNNIVYKSGKYGVFVYQHDGGVGKVGRSLVVANNIVHEAQKHGIYLYSESTDSHGEAMVFAHNVCGNNGQDGATGWAGIKLMYASRAIVQGNICYDDQATPTQYYGIHLYYCDPVQLTPDNMCYGNANAGAQVLVDGTYDVRDGSTREYRYIVTSITADDTNRITYPDRDITVSRDWRVSQGGYVVGIRAVIQDATTGAINVYPTINGAVKSGVAVTLNAGAMSAASERWNSIGNSSYELSVGDRIGAVYNADSSGSYTAPLVVIVTVKHCV